MQVKKRGKNKKKKLGPEIVPVKRGKKAKAAMAWDLEQKLKVIFESANDIIVCVDQRGMIVDINRKVKDILGYRSEEVKGRRVFDLPIYGPQDAKQLKKTFTRTIKTGRLITHNGRAANVLEFALRHKDGRAVEIESSTRVYRTPGREILFISIIRDITKRKVAERALRTVLERFTAFMESANEGFVLFDADLNVVDVNDYMLKTFDVKKEKVLGKSLYDFSYDAYETGRHEKYKRVIATGKPFSQEVQVPGYLGNRLLSIKSFKAGDGLGMVVRDITSEKAVEKGLRESEQRFRVLYEAVHAGVIVHTSDNRVTHINKTGCRLLGVEECHEDMSLGSVFRLVDKDGKTLPGSKHPSFMTLRTGKPVHQAICGLRFEGKEKIRWLIVNTEPILDPESGKVDEIILTFFDITDRKNAEQMLKESEHRYRHLFENCTLGIGLSSPDGRIIQANKAMQAITGYTMEDADSITIADLFADPEDRLALREILEKQGQVANYQVKLRRKDGSVFDALVNIKKVIVDNKEFFQTICQEIGDFKTFKN